MYQGGRSKEKHMDSRINVSGINTLDNVYFMFFIMSFGKFGNRKIRAASFSCGGMMVDWKYRINVSGVSTC